MSSIAVNFTANTATLLTDNMGIARRKAYPTKTHDSYAPCHWPNGDSALRARFRIDHHEVRKKF
jgi:hypothetical protein